MARRWPEVPRHHEAGGVGPGGVPGGQVAEDHGVGDARARPQVVAAHDGGGAVAGGVEPRQSPAVLVDDPRVARR